MKMKINLNDYERTAQPNFRGGEGEYVSRMLNDGTNKVIWGMLAPGHSIGMHTHETNSETMFILTGKGQMHFPDGTYEEVAPGDILYCPHGGTHALVNVGDEDLTFHAVVPEHGVASST